MERHSGSLLWIVLLSWGMSASAALVVGAWVLLGRTVCALNEVDCHSAQNGDSLRIALWSVGVFCLALTTASAVRNAMNARLCLSMLAVNAVTQAAAFVSLAT